MTSEFPSAPSEQGGEGLHAQKTGDPDRIREKIKVLIRTRLQDDASIPELEKRLAKLNRALLKYISREKKRRINRMKLKIRRDELRDRVLELKREKLQKNSQISSQKGRIRLQKEEISSGRISEVVRLEHRVLELDDSVNSFVETLTMHHRDRDRVLLLLLDAFSELQDQLTECVLWRIMYNGSADRGNIGRTGQSGITAEFLGRLLVLEKEISQLNGSLARIKSGEVKERNWF